MVMTTMFGGVVAQESIQLNTEDSIRQSFIEVDRKILEMARDFPAEKYDYRLKLGMRSFRELLIHIISGNRYAARIGRGEKVNWDELSARLYPTKDSVITLMEEYIRYSESAIKETESTKFPIYSKIWLDVMEHSAEHYGLLIAYYRLNDLVPPESRRKNGTP